LADWHDEHEAFKKKIPKLHAQNAEREAKASAKADRPGLVERLRAELQARGLKTHAASKAPARPVPAKERER
jgi:hypothetical protein